MPRPASGAAKLEPSDEQPHAGMPPAWLRVTFILAMPPAWLRVTFILAMPPAWLRVKVPNVRTDEGDFSDLSWQSCALNTRARVSAGAWPRH
jgi:hypothetical protein